jgi:type IX secretion system substrate protein
MKKVTLTIVLCLTILSTHFFAQTHNWTGNGGDTDWFNTSNWDAGSIPVNTSSVMISGNFIVNISGNSAEAHTVDIINDSTLELESSLTTVSIITIDPNSTFQFIAGTLSGSGIVNNGLLKLEGNSTRTFDQTSITNNSQFLVTNSNQTQVLNTTIYNSPTGVIDIASVGGFLQQNTSSTLNNDGILIKNPDGINPIGNFYLILEINNEGVIDVLQDETFLLLAGASTFTNFESGRILGSGTYDITTNFINEGTVSPGNSPLIGNLQITNNFSLNGGKIEIDIAGLQTGEFDLITVNGNPAMTGIIEVNLLYAPQVNDEFTVVTATSGIGNCDFPQFISSEFQGMEYTFEIICNSSDVTLRLDAISVLGIEDFSSTKFEFYVHPNPVINEAAFVFSSEMITSEETSLVIYNYLGQQVLNIDGFNSENNTFHRGNLSGGLYLARLEAQGKVLATTKIVLE